jgi:hypothetical protein
MCSPFWLLSSEADSKFKQKATFTSGKVMAKSPLLVALCFPDTWLTLYSETEIGRKLMLVDEIWRALNKILPRQASVPLLAPKTEAAFAR